MATLTTGAIVSIFNISSKNKQYYSHLFIKQNTNLESLSNSYKILTSDFNEESNAYLIKNGNNNSNITSKELNLSNEKSDFKIEIPRISSKDIRSQRSHSPLNELEQKSFIFNDFGARIEANKLVTKFKSNELEESIKKAKKFAMEQSVRFALVKQQQQQQKQQLELIKKQQALLLMCRSVNFFKIKI